MRISNRRVHNYNVNKILVGCTPESEGSGVHNGWDQLTAKIIHRNYVCMPIRELHHKSQFCIPLLTILRLLHPILGQLDRQTDGSWCIRQGSQQPAYKKFPGLAALINSIMLSAARQNKILENIWFEEKVLLRCNSFKHQSHEKYFSFSFSCQSSIIKVVTLVYQNGWHFWNSPKGPTHWAEFESSLYFKPEIHCGLEINCILRWPFFISPMGLLHKGDASFEKMQLDVGSEPTLLYNRHMSHALS